MATAIPQKTAATAAWADLSGRRFFAWRMAVACGEALRQVHQAAAQQADPDRAQALEKVDRLLRHELLRWVRRGEALDLIADHLPQPG